MKTDIDQSPEGRRQTQAEQATAEHPDPDVAAYQRLYRALAEPLPVPVPPDLVDRLVRRRARAALRARLQWAMFAVLAIAVGGYGLAVSLSSLAAASRAPLTLAGAIEWPLVGFTLLTLAASVTWVGRRLSRS